MKSKHRSTKRSGHATVRPENPARPRRQGTRPPLSRNLDALFGRAYDPPKMNEQVSDRILDTLMHQVQAPWVQTPAPATDEARVRPCGKGVGSIGPAEANRGPEAQRGPKAGRRPEAGPGPEGGTKMAKQAENSVLFSLKELRTIEDDRLRAEDDERKRRMEEQRTAAEETRRRRREEEESRIRQEQERIRAEQQEKERAEREAGLRLQEAQIRARAQQEAQIEAERLRLEMEVRTSGSSRWLVTALVGCFAFVALGGSVVGYYLYRQSQEQKRLRKLQTSREQEYRRQLAALHQEQARLKEIERKKNDLLEKMRTAAEEQKKKLAQQVASLNTEGDRLRKKIHTRKKSIRDKKSKTSAGKKTTDCDPADPLCRIHD